MTDKEIISLYNKKREALLFVAVRDRKHDLYLTVVDIETCYDDLLIKVIKYGAKFDAIEKLDYYIYKSFNQNLKELFNRNKNIRNIMTQSERVANFNLARDIINHARQAGKKFSLP